MILLAVKGGKVHAGWTYNSRAHCGLDLFYTPFDRRDGTADEITCRRCLTMPLARQRGVARVQAARGRSVIAPIDLALARQILACLPLPTARRVAEATGARGDRVARTIEALISEGMVEVRDNAFHLTELGALLTADDRDGAAGEVSG